jgi:hypothetical protein
MCAETIKATAKVCPHCRHWLKRWSLANPQVGMTLYALAAVILLVGLGLWIETMFGSKEQFVDHKDEITVLGSVFTHRTSGTNVYVTVVGTLTNHGSLTWKDVGVEAQFFDESGELIDVTTVNADSYRGVALLPHSEAAFKVEGRAARPETNYASHKTFVRWAKDAAAWP